MGIFRFEYHWQDGDKYKKPTRLSAPGMCICCLQSIVRWLNMTHIFSTEYVEALMDWVQKQLEDETIFPSKMGEHTCLLLKAFKHN